MLKIPKLNDITGYDPETNQTFFTTAKIEDIIQIFRITYTNNDMAYTNEYTTASFGELATITTILSKKMTIGDNIQIDPIIIELSNNTKIPKYTTCEKHNIAFEISESCIYCAIENNAIGRY